MSKKIKFKLIHNCVQKETIGLILFECNKNMPTIFYWNFAAHVYSYLVIRTIKMKDMDVRLSSFQKKKMHSRIRTLEDAEKDLRNDIQKLELRQTSDESIMCILNQYWNRVCF
ncbi:hypothetical protein A3Q56_00652 [Intoshia linei]|uniref:Uncharacterized protein n=1 Tax=Intoshia linei TaxID=1819745 RepID=A0A177BDC9_9BILA|nr:hypothetical protein A3Q56_00652 [Intoshia linei]